MRAGRRALRGLALGLAMACAMPLAHAGAVAQRFCDAPRPLTALQQAQLLEFAAAVKRELDASGATVALVARSGLQLQRFGHRYSHAGFAFKHWPAENQMGEWAVRQLYYACEEGRPQVFDQGLGGFVSGTEDAGLGFLSVLILPPELARAVQAAVMDKARALQMLGLRYSANAYALATWYQNCNQWLAEMLAASAAQDTVRTRTQAQAWLATHGYAPAGVDLGSHLLVAVAPFLPWLHVDDHPLEDLQALRMRTTMPADLEALVRRLAPEVRRIEFCHREGAVRVRHGQGALPEDCGP